MRRIAALLFVFSLVYCVTRPALAQEGSATLTGFVQDSSKAVIPGVKVTAINTSTEQHYGATTSKDGSYTIASLPVGPYQMQIEKPGFKTILKDDLFLHTQDALEINFQMAVGSTSETVTVNGTTTNDSPAVSMTVSREFIEDMPLNGRSLQDLIQLAPGTVSSTNGSYSIDGQRVESNNFTVDGTSANLGGILNYTGKDGALGGSVYAVTELGTTQSLVSVDDLQEFKTQTSGYTAEYGRNPGGQVSLTTRSGTNSVHGTLFEYLRNTAFDANSYSNDYYGNPQTAEHQNDYGGTVGGPILIPRIYNGMDKSFYFISLERLKLLIPAFESEYVPTQAFREWASPNVQPFLNSAPLPDTNSPGNQDGCTITDPSTRQSAACDALYSYGYSNPSQLYNIAVRLDHNFGKRLRAFIRFANTPSSGLTEGITHVDSSINVLTGTAGLTANINDALLNELRFNYSQDEEINIITQGAVKGAVPVERDLFISPTYDNHFAGGGFTLYVPNTSLYYGPQLYGHGSKLYQEQLVDSLTWTKGSHSVKFGEDWRRFKTYLNSGSYNSFLELTSLLSFQQGLASTLNISASSPGSPVFNNVSLYVQDHWKLKSGLSLDYGIRWELNPPPGPSNGHYPATLTSDNLATATLTTGGTPTWQTKYDAFAPRFGFAWNLIPLDKHPLTMRGGFGIYFDTAQQAIGEAYYSGYPFFARGPYVSNVKLPFSTSELAPPVLNQPLTTPYPGFIYLTSPNLTLPYTEQWNLSLDQSLSARNTFTVSYVGSKGQKLLYEAYHGSVPENADFSSLLLIYNGSNSNYHALQVQDTGRIANGLEVVASFTLAHALDNASESVGGESVPVYGNSDNDLRRALNLAMNYQIPTVDRNGEMRAFTRGWMLASRFLTQSGLPLNITQTGVVTGDGSYYSYFPDLVSGVSIYLHGRAADVGGKPVPGSWRLNPKAFSLVPTDLSSTPIRQGTLGRNYVRGPSFWALNTAVQRTFTIYEQLHLAFKAEAFNLLNHPNQGNPDTYLTDSTFGEELGGTRAIGSTNQLYAMGAARSLQFSLKLQF